MRQDGTQQPAGADKEGGSRMDVRGGCATKGDGEYQRISRSVFLESKLWREPLKKMAGAPFFLRRGGLGPLFVHFALLLKIKRNSRGIFQKKSSREILKRCSRQILQYNNTDRKYRKPSKSDTSKIPIPKKLLVTPWYTTLVVTASLSYYVLFLIVSTFACFAVGSWRELIANARNTRPGLLSLPSALGDSANNR